MWVFNPGERAGLYQQHPGRSFPSGWDCGESLYPSYLLRINSAWHAADISNHTQINDSLSLLHFKSFMTFIVNSKHDYLSRVDHRPLQAGISDPEMVSHIKMKQGREHLYSCHVDLDNKMAACFDAHNYPCVSCSAKNQSVNIHSWMLTHLEGGANIVSCTAGCANGENKSCNQLIQLFLDHPAANHLYRACLTPQIY